MDQILADVSKVPTAQIGDEAVIIGRQHTGEIFAHELATQAGTIAWNIFTGLTSRVKRFHR
jgi:alanine racemase